MPRARRATTPRARRRPSRHWPSRTPALLSRYQATVAELAGKGYRALGVGQSDDGKTWSIVGLISLMDPPRPDAKATIDAAEALGLNVKMVTGDDVAIGDQIANQLGHGRSSPGRERCFQG